MTSKGKSRRNKKSSLHKKKVGSKGQKDLRAAKAKGPKQKFSLKKIPWPLVRIYLFFGATILCLFLVLNSSPVHKSVIEPFTTFIALISSKILNLLGTQVTVSGTHISSGGFGINIVDGCNGVFTTAILVAGIVAYPSKIKEKIIGILVGFPAIFIVNQLRVISLFYLGRSKPTVFEEVHVYAWQPIIILFAIFVWDFWARHFVRKGEVRKASVSH